MGDRGTRRIARMWVAAGAAGLTFGACDRPPTPAPTPAPTPTGTAPLSPTPGAGTASSTPAATPTEAGAPERFGPVPVVEGPVGAALDEFFKRSVAHGFSGCVLVAVDDKVVLHNGYGFSDRDLKVPINLRTRFDVGSIAKQFTAAAALRLVMQGKLALDEPIVRWFDVETLGLIPERNRTITLKHLLSHTSGIPRMYDVDGVDMTDRDAVVARLLAPEFQRPPGRTHMYSNANYFILAAVIERASGMAFERAMHELVFEPAGLTDTMICGEDDPDEARASWGESADSVVPAPRLADLIATGHEDNAPSDEVDVRMDMGNGWYPHGAQGPAHRMPFGWGHRGATGVITTPADLLKWHRVLATDQVLSAEMRKLIVTPAIRTYAMGWEVGQMDNGMYMVGHSGSMIGFEADLRRYFSNLQDAELGRNAKAVTIIASNSRGQRTHALRQVLERALLKGTDGSEPALPQPPAVPASAEAPVDPGVLDACLGVYALPSGGELMIAPGEGKGDLVVHALGQDAVGVINPPTAHAAPIFGYTSRRAERVLKAWISDDAADAREHRKSIDPTISDETIAQWAARWKTCGGAPLTSIRPIASYTQERQLQTVVMLEYPTSSELIRVLWSEDLVTGIEPADALPVGAELVPECGWPNPSFATMGKEWWMTMRLVFERGEGAQRGAAEAVVVKSLGREVRATRVK